MLLDTIKDLKNLAKNLSIPKELLEKIEKASPDLNSAGLDPWGLDPDTYKVAVNLLKWFYTDYFRVEVSGLENIPEGRVMLVSNHGCQIPLDAVLISGAMILDAPDPRIIRAMVDRWVPTLPFVSSFFTQMGEVVGSPQNCTGLLKKENCVLIFPEGTGGCGKSIFERYQLQKFGTGFVHIALETKAPIVPVSVIGTEEIYPSLHNFKLLAKLLKFPYFPITPLFPFFGVAGAFPLPCKVSIKFGEPISFDEYSNVQEGTARRLANKVKKQIQSGLDSGVKKRGNKIFTGSAL